jgi:two-component system cell cycle sensor histidine kinase/response regulator CckA
VLFMLPYADNTLILHFVATGAPLLDPVMFEVQLDGADDNWLAAGSAGSAVFNRLGEGEHTLLVRPTSLGLQGEVTALRFKITAPWYRTFWAYFGAAALLVVTVMIIGRFFTYLERREKHRLEKLVTLRTRELHESNVRLATQVEENRTLSQAIQQSPVGVLLVKPDGTIVFANSRVCELSGYALAELAGRPIDLLREPGPREQEQAVEFARARQAGDSWQAHLVNRTKGGRPLHVRITASPLKSQQGDIALYLVLEEDITESLAEQERRRRLEAQLFQAQKRESLGTLAGGIAHDFNNILTGILGYCELARLTLGPDSAVEQELVSITSAGRRARDLVSQILSFTRPGNPQLAPLDLAQPVAEALRLFRASTPANVELVQTLESGGVRADASQIHQVVLNLCTNAAHALRRNSGRIDVGLEPVRLDAAQAAEFGVEPGDYMRLRVADNGCGMAPAVLDRIFDPFFTTKDPGEGTGLGLPIVQGIVTTHRGGLRVKSEPGAGTTFDAVFPVTHEARPAARPPAPVPGGGNEEILVVDDEAMVTDFVAARLRQLGYRPTVLNDPRAALEALATEPSRFGALITDLTMPHLSGVELIGRLRQQGVRVPTLIITGYNRNSARADLASVPDVPVLQKPFTGDELAQAVHRVLARK